MIFKMSFFLQLSSVQELKLPVYHAHSPQIGMRRYFADLLAILSNRYQLCATARHLAVYLLDLFMDHYDVAIKQLYVIALSCLLLASEYSLARRLAPALASTGVCGQNKLGTFVHFPLRASAVFCSIGLW